MFEEPKNEQDKYRVGIIVALDNNIRVDGFKNPGPDHTIIIDEEFIKRAKSRVCILCNHLGQDVWCTQGVLNALDTAIQNGARVDVITRNFVDTSSGENKFFSKIEEYLKNGKASYNNFENVSNISANILIVDKKHYRIEPTPILDGKPNRKAFAGIHCPDVASAWEEEFNKVCCQ